MTETESEVLLKYIQEELRKGFIRPSKSPISSSIFFVKKKDRTLRPVVDYRYLNTITVKNRYPLPLMTEMVERLGGMKYFNKLDLHTGYNLIRITEGDEWKTAFTNKFELYEYIVMPFGLCNAPAVFQHFMNDIFRPLMIKRIAIYLDDILNGALQIIQLRETTMEVLQILDENDLYAKPSKCKWEVPEVEFLGMIASEKGVKIDTGKTDAIKEWPALKNLRQLQQFIGFANFYWKFIEDWSKLCRGMNDLLKKDVKWHWNENTQKSFKLLKAQFEGASILIHADTTKQFLMETDASDFAIGRIFVRL